MYGISLCNSPFLLCCRMDGVDADSFAGHMTCLYVILRKAAYLGDVLCAVSACFMFY